MSCETVWCSARCSRHETVCWTAILLIVEVNVRMMMMRVSCAAVLVAPQVSLGALTFCSATQSLRRPPIRGAPQIATTFLRTVLQTFAVAISPPAPPSPTPAPAPPSPTPAPAPPSPLTGIKGYYSWNWGTGSAGPPGRERWLRLHGPHRCEERDQPSTPQAPAGAVRRSLGRSNLSLGGGNSAGIFNEAALTAISSSVADITAAGCEGVMFDVEEVEGSSGTMVPAFAKSLCCSQARWPATGRDKSQRAQPVRHAQGRRGLREGVDGWTPTSTSSLRSCTSSGSESSPENAETSSCKAAGCTWDLYEGSRSYRTVHCRRGHERRGAQLL